MADISPGGLTAIVGACTALGTAAGRGWAWLLTFQRGRRRDEVLAYQDITRRQQQSLDRLQAQVDELQKAINTMAALHDDCRAENAELYGLLVLQHSTMRRWHELLTERGLAVEPVPDLPPRPGRRPLAEADFLRRSTQQASDLVTGRPPPPPGHDRGAAP